MDADTFNGRPAASSRRAWRAAAALALALALAGCQSGVAVGTVTTETYVTIEESGAGTVDSSTRYDSAALAAAFPGGEVRTVRTAVEDSTVSTFAVFEDGVQVIQVYRGADGTVDEIHGVTHRLAGPNGERIGMSMADARVTRDSCRAGRNLWRGMAVCPARGTDNVFLVFAIPSYQGPFDGLPSAEDLRRAELQRIVWRG